MAENECWIAAELAATGDADTVIETVVEETERHFRGQKQGEMVILHGKASSFGDVKGPLQTVADHLDRLVFVGSTEGGGGRTHSKYVTDTDDLRNPTEELDTTPGRWWVGQHFDYYTTKYDIDAAV
ncbi:hypothetical protein [Natronorubrum sp. FCH18a]|uniref:hypothetical protein n=1 Tax=Natronorubrum sp. FCH18a TaxID=3447018 RepID=UPI003F517B33